MRLFIISIILSLCAIFLSAAPSEAAKKDPCLGCHTDKTPGVVAYWQNSAHAPAKVMCSQCHGSDVKANHDRSVTVKADKCGKCHKDAFKGHSISKHALGMQAGQGCTRNMPKSREKMRTCDQCHDPDSAKPRSAVDCARFMAQSPAMQRQGCLSCHRVETSCESCHTRHGTDTAIAAKAETCGTCHMGPDHAQLEMWKASVHGVLYQAGQKKTAPTCVTCHMREGTHNVSIGIATGKPAHKWEQERKAMLDICARCHTRKMAERNLNDADAIQSQSYALVMEAKAIVDELAEEGLLKPSPKNRQPHPKYGQSLVLGPEMLYENLSSVEAKFFRMIKFHYITTFKGAMHQSPDYTHWYGNSNLKLTLSEIKSEAAALREASNLQKRIDSLRRFAPLSNTGEGQNDIKSMLRTLNDRLYKGEITKKQHRDEKKRLLDSKGL